MYNKTEDEYAQNNHKDKCRPGVRNVLFDDCPVFNVLLAVIGWI
jgi:hypothetical protein